MFQTTKQKNGDTLLSSNVAMENPPIKQISFPLQSPTKREMVNSCHVWWHQKFSLFGFGNSHARPSSTPNMGTMTSPEEIFATDTGRTGFWSLVSCTEQLGEVKLLPALCAFFESGWLLLSGVMVSKSTIKAPAGPAIWQKLKASANRQGWVRSDVSVFTGFTCENELHICESKMAQLRPFISYKCL